jgi:AcrR family transcriptional regulator
MTDAVLNEDLAGIGADGVVRRGRPRSIEADAAILDATLELIDETGLTGLSVESVAARAGVGKATIYRRWPSKEALVASALARCSEENPVVETSGSLRDQLVAFVEQIRCKSPETHSGRIMPRMLSHASRSPELFRIYFDQVIRPRRARVRGVLEDAVLTGELRDDIDLDLAVTMISAPMLYLNLVQSANGAPGPGSTEALVDAVLNGLRPRTPASGS